MIRTPRGRLLQNGGYERKHARLTSYSDDRRKTSSLLDRCARNKHSKQDDTLNDDRVSEKSLKLKARSRMATFYIVRFRTFTYILFIIKKSM